MTGPGAFAIKLRVRSELLKDTTRLVVKLGTGVLTDSRKQPRDSSLAWCHPPIAHVHWDDTPLVRRVLRWLSAVIKGCPDRKTVLFPAQFVPSGTIGPAGKG